jgi:hypothetical protein
MDDTKKHFLCRACNHEDVESAFGKGIVCPRCRSAEVVLAAVWHRFKQAQSCGAEPGSLPEQPAGNLDQPQG